MSNYFHYKNQEKDASVAAVTNKENRVNSSNTEQIRKVDNGEDEERDFDELPIPVNVVVARQDSPDETEEEDAEDELSLSDISEQEIHLDQVNKLNHLEDKCSCGLVHIESTLQQCLQNPPALPKDPKTGWHSCVSWWLETTHRVSNKLFICLTCFREKDKLKTWCFKTNPMLYNVKRHYQRKHVEDPVTKLMFPTMKIGPYSSDSLNKDILQWIIHRNRPFGLVDDPEFRLMIQKLNPELKLLHSQRLKDKFLPVLEAEMNLKVTLIFFMINKFIKGLDRF